MTVENDIMIVIVVIFWVIVFIFSIYCRIYQQRQGRERVHRHISNVITSQTRPLIIYHVAVPSNQESLPPCYDQVISNGN